MSGTAPCRHVLVTGAAGYIGRQVVAALVEDPRDVSVIVATDVRLPPSMPRHAGVHYVHADVRSGGLHEILERFAIDLVVHLAAVVTPPPGMTREQLYDIDVRGTRNVLEACLAAGVRRIIYTSSGAAYGYHVDNPASLREEDALRGNDEFAYSHHKRLIEEMLASWRSAHPELEQLVFRVCTILGESTSNQISALFDGSFVLGLAGASTPFSLVWDGDVVGAITRGIHEGRSGIYNLAGDGTLTLHEMAEMAGKTCVDLPPAVVAGGLWLLQNIGMSRYGPEQVDFLRYRPVLDNHRLREEFGYAPRMTAREVFETFLRARRTRAAGVRS